MSASVAASAGPALTPCSCGCATVCLRYHSAGYFFGLMCVAVASVLHMVFALLEWWTPAHTIEVCTQRRRSACTYSQALTRQRTNTVVPPPCWAHSSQLAPDFPRHTYVPLRVRRCVVPQLQSVLRGSSPHVPGRHASHRWHQDALRAKYQPILPNDEPRATPKRARPAAARGQPAPLPKRGRT